MRVRPHDPLTRRLAIAGVILVALSFAITANANAATTTKAPPIAWPQAPCDLAHRMDIAIVEGMFFECQCMRLMTGYQCDWYLVAGISSAKLSRKVKRPAKPRIAIHATHPAVVA